MKLLLLKDVKSMTRQQLTEKLNDLEDKACNTDYVTEWYKSEIIQRNIRTIESVLYFNEF